MAAVTQVIPNFLGGVSRQTDQKKLPGQVRDCLNAYPDPTFGLMKRPGFKFIKDMYTSSSAYDPELKNGKWFFIKRDNEEVYIGCILRAYTDTESTVADSDHSTNPIRIWNKQGTEVTPNITYEGDTKKYLNTTHDNYDILTVQDTSIITNKTKVCKPADPTGNHVSGSYGTIRLMNVAYSTRYMVKVKVGGTLYGTKYHDSIKYIGNSNNLVDGDRTEGSYLNVTPTTQKHSNGNTVSPTEQATFNITVNAAGGTIVSLNNRGRGYQKGDKFTFNDAALGGANAAKALEISDGKTGASGRTSGTYTVPVTAAMTNGNGEDAEIKVYISDDTDKTASFLLIDGGKNFDTQELITITSSELSEIGSTNLVLKVTELKTPKDLETEVLELNDEDDEEIAAQYYTINAEDNTPANQISTPADEKFLTAKRILRVLKGGETDAPYNKGLKDLVISGHSVEVDQLDATLEVKIKNTSTGKYVAFELITSDNQGNSSIQSFNEDVNSVADLPAQSTHNRKVKVINSGPADTTYWSKFVAEDGEKGKGYWEETIDPTVSAGLDKTTMPHELFNNGTDHFIFRQGGWKDRTVGDDSTNTHPGFILKDEDTGNYLRTIQQCFYHNNRLGILTDDNVVMSKSGEFFDFYYTSALTVIDSDPIDINCSSLRPAVLHAVLPTAQGLILFSNNQQFIMFSDAEMLTPASAIIRGISNYEMDPKIDPVESGTLLNFVSKTPSTTRVFSVQTRGAEESPDVMDVGKIVSGWIPQTIKNLLSSPVNSLIVLYGDNSNVTAPGSPTVYMYKTYIVGERIVMQAWVKWDLPGNVQHISIDADIMYAVVENSGKYILCSTNLTEAPEGDTILTTADGQKINPYMDLYSKATNGKGTITTFDHDGAADNTRTPGTYIYNNALSILPTGIGSGSDWKIVVANDGTPTITLMDGGIGHTVNNKVLVNVGSGANIEITVTGINAAEKSVVYDTDGDFTKCYIPYTDLTDLNPVILIAGDARYGTDTKAGFTINPTKDTDSDGDVYFKVPGKDLTTSYTGTVYVGYQYNYDVELPKTYYKLNPEGTQYDYTANLTVARMKFAVGLSSVCGFKVKSKGYRGEIWEGTIIDAKTGTSGTGYDVPFPLKEENGIKVTLNGVKQASTEYTVASTDTQSTVTFDNAPKGHTVKQLFGGTGYTAATNVATTSSGNGTGLTVDTTVVGGVITAVTVNSQGTGYKPNEVITISGGTISATFLIDTLPQVIAITTDTWYDIQPSSEAGQYLADDVPLIEENIFTIPLHQRSENFNMKVFSNSPFPVSLTSMMWEGQYSPRFYRRT